jgi:hypothetical protein
LFRQPDITVTPDPLAPSPTTIAQGVRIALQQVRIRGRPCVVRFNPLPARDAGFLAYHLDCDRHHRLVVSLEPDSKPAPVDPPGSDGASAEIFTPRHPLPLRITDTPVDLRLSAAGKRIESRDLNQVTGIGHSLLLAGVVAAAAGTANFWIGAAVATALATHLLLEAGGRREITPWLPFSKKTWHDRRLWDDRSWRTNLCAGTLAAGLIVAVLFAGK